MAKITGPVVTLRLRGVWKIWGAIGVGGLVFGASTFAAFNVLAWLFW